MFPFLSSTLSLATLLSVLLIPAQATRLFEQRSGLEVPPVNASGWTVPLQGLETCRPNNGSDEMRNCKSLAQYPQQLILILIGTDSLTNPPGTDFLQALAIGKGLFNYSCADIDADSPPSFHAQYTVLYDAAPLIPILPNEDSFHALISMILEYDYAKMENTSLTCMGTIGTLDGTAVVTLYDIDTFEATHSETVLAPEGPLSNAIWSRAWSAENMWQVYRVETHGGRPPATCRNQPHILEIEYAAEYWFYRREG